MQISAQSSEPCWAGTPGQVTSSGVRGFPSRVPNASPIKVKYPKSHWIYSVMRSCWPAPVSCPSNIYVGWSKCGSQGCLSSPESVSGSHHCCGICHTEIAEMSVSHDFLPGTYFWVIIQQKVLTKLEFCVNLLFPPSTACILFWWDLELHR